MADKCRWFPRVHEVTGVDGDHPTVRDDAHQIGYRLLRDMTPRAASYHKSRGCDRGHNPGPAWIEVVDFWAHLLHNFPVECQDARGLGWRNRQTRLKQPYVFEHKPAHQLGTCCRDLTGHKAAQGVTDKVDGALVKTRVQ